MTLTESERVVKRYDHGTNACYKLNKCRCEPCSNANSRYESERRSRLEPAYIAAGPARTHVLELKAAGVGLKQIAKSSGVPHGTLSKLVYGDPRRGMAPSKRVRKTTLDRLIAVTPAAIAGGANIPAGPTWELIDAMTAAGVPKAFIAREIGQRGPGLQLSRNLVSARNAQAVADLYRRWSGGDVTAIRRDSYGNHKTVSAPVQVRRPTADISDLLLELAEIVEERNEQPWRAQAACRSRPVYLWFPSRGDNRTAEKALQICKACTVRDQCRAANLDKRDGIYGALTGKARRRLRGAA